MSLQSGTAPIGAGLDTPDYPCRIPDLGFKVLDERLLREEYPLGHSFIHIKLTSPQYVCGFLESAQDIKDPCPQHLLGICPHRGW